MKRKLIANSFLSAILVVLVCFGAIAQVEGVEVEKPQEEKKEEKKDESKKDDDEEEKMTLKERLFFGGSFGASFGTVTFVDVSPMVGYRITKRYSAGLGITYNYFNDKRFEPQHIFGGRLFNRFDVAQEFLGVGNLFLHAEVEGLNANEYYQDANTGFPEKRRKWYVSPFVGAGLAFPIGNRSAFTILALYNPVYDENSSLYGSPLQIRIGGFF